MSNSKKNLISSIITIIVSIGAVVLLSFMVKDVVKANNTWIMAVCVVGGVIGGMIIHIVVHELMHLIFGLCAGFKPYAFNIFGISFINVNGKKIRKQTGKNANGFCSMYFTKTNHEYLRLGLFVFGGLFGSILVTTASFLFMFLCKNVNPYIYVMISATVVINVYVLLANLIPSSVNNASNDGNQFFGVLFKNAYAKLTCKAIIIEGMIINGVKPSEIDRDFILDVPVVEDGASEKINYQTMLYSYYLDCFTNNKEDADAKKGMDNIVKSLINSFEDIIVVYKTNVASLILYHLLKNDGDAKQIEKFFEECKIALLGELTMDNMRIKMAYELYHQKNYQLALITGKSALCLKDEFIYVGLAGLEEKLINEQMKDCSMAIVNEQINSK